MKRVFCFAIRTSVIPVVLFWAVVPSGAEEIDLSGKNATINPLRKLDLSAFSGFIERPLFSPSRRAEEPAEMAADATTEVTPPSLDIKLLGVVITPDGAIARIQNNGDGTTQSLQKGDKLEDWDVVAIDQSGIELARNGEIKAFTVFRKDAARGASEDALPGELGLESQEGAPLPDDQPEKKIRVIVPTAITEQKKLETTE